MIECHVKGLRELDAQLKRFPILLQQNILDKATAAGARIARDAAKSNAPVRTGEMLRSIRMVKNRKSKEATSYLVGVFKKGWYGRLVESGTKAHTIKAKNAKVLTDGKSFFGKEVKIPMVRARPWLSPALTFNQERIVKKVGETIKKWLDRYDRI
jgi:HK97 gp10 family phage protein